MKTLLKTLRSSVIVALGIASVAGVSYTFAAPTQPPNAGSGVDLPLHVGSAAQVKSGDLTVSGLLTASGTLNVGSTINVPTICLNGSCSTGWPSASVTPSSVSTSPWLYLNYCNNCTPSYYSYSLNTTITYSGSGTLINAYSTAGCPNMNGYNPTSSIISVSVADPFARTANVDIKCGYNNWINYPQATFNFGGITI